MARNVARQIDREAEPAGYPPRRVPSLMRRVREAVAAIEAVGGTVAAVNISPEGAVSVLTMAGQVPAIGPSANEWDEVLAR